MHIFWGYSSSGVIFALFTQLSDFRLQGDQSLATSSDFYAINPKTCVIFGLFIVWLSFQHHKDIKDTSGNQKLHKVWLELGNI